MPAVPDDITRYHANLDDQARPICDLLLDIIEREPVRRRPLGLARPTRYGFFDRNPVVGRLKSSARLLSWSGQSFPTPRLHPEGSLRAAETRYTAPEQVDSQRVSDWPADARQHQWNYRDTSAGRASSAQPVPPGSPAQADP